MKRRYWPVLVLPLLLGSAWADDHGRHSSEGRGHGGEVHVRPESHGRTEWHGQIERFHEHDADLWRGGRWHQGRHDGRYGWWWVVGATWYFYPYRVEPYPDPYQPPVVVLPPPPAPPQYWYYCANPAGYYPYVARCFVGWQRVPALQPAVP